MRASHKTSMLFAAGVLGLAAGSVQAADIPVYAEAKVGTQTSSGQTTAAVSGNGTQYNGNGAPPAETFGWASVDVNRPQGIIRMRATIDRQYNPDQIFPFGSLSESTKAYYNDQITLPEMYAPSSLSLEVGLHAVVSGAPDGPEGSRAWTRTQIQAYTVGDPGEFYRIDDSAPNADMVGLLDAPAYNSASAPAYVTVNPGASGGDVLLSGGQYSAPLDSYAGPTVVPETFSGVSYEATVTIDIPLEKIEGGVAYYPFQLQVETDAGVAGGGTAEADLGQSITLNKVTDPDGLVPDGFSFESGASLVPEPGSLALLGVGGLLLLRRGRAAGVA